MASNDAQGAEKKEGSGRSWLWVLLLLLLIGGGYYLWTTMQKEEPVEVGEDGRFKLAFTGCDSQGRCGQFRILAPGFAYRWDYGRDTLQSINGVAPDLRAVLGDQLVDAEKVIATGLASNEGGEAFNRRLSACRSKRLAFLTDDVQLDEQTAAETYRLTLGRYQPALTAGAAAEDTAIERLVVFGFQLSADEGINLDEALKDGLIQALPSALDQALGPVARQLDFTRYSCWQNEFAVTPDAELRRACYTESSADPETFCGDF